MRDAERERRSAAAVRDRRGLVCAACEHAITDDASRIDMAGAHEHTFVNPAGAVLGPDSHRAAARMISRCYKKIRGRVGARSRRSSCWQRRQSNARDDDAQERCEQ
jgi:hypothetical protein